MQTAISMKKSFRGKEKWSEESHLRRYKNDWVLDIIEGGPNGDFVLGYDYHNCGICNLCRDEGCFELAKISVPYGFRAC